MFTGFILDLSAANYLKIVRSNFSKNSKICKVVIKWDFGKVKLKFAENQAIIWRERFLSTFGSSDGQENNAQSLLSVNQTKNASRTSNNDLMILDEGWDTTESVTSMTGSYTLRSQLSENLEDISEISQANMNDSAKSSVTSEIKKLCNYHRLLEIINRKKSSKNKNDIKEQHMPTEKIHENNEEVESTNPQADGIRINKENSNNAEFYNKPNTGFNLLLQEPLESTV
ncbi:unnamed protein product [Thelazia callipaeda]|uniref:Uncharacterized protein n=1 Tax=Thelazia callipaeda TaxID=103827 RepID=A0A0N5D8C0_THECL|nr:unnamed protein product [Thelazia callipaeda]